MELRSPGGAGSLTATETVRTKAQAQNGAHRTVSSIICRMEILRSLFYFVLAGLCEVGGGYLVWMWLRQGRGWITGLTGAAILVLYGVIPTLQPAHFGRIYAAYRGIFIVLSGVRASYTVQFF